MPEMKTLLTQLAALGLNAADPRARAEAEDLEDEGRDVLAAFARAGALTRATNRGFYDPGRHGALLQRICAPAGVRLDTADGYVDAGAPGVQDLVLLARVGEQELAFHRGPSHDVLSEAYVGLVLRAAKACLELAKSDWSARCLLNDTELLFVTLPRKAETWLTGREGRPIRARLAEELDLEQFAWVSLTHLDAAAPLPPTEARRLLG